MIDDKFCRDCRHHLSESTFDHRCLSPALGLNLVTGEINTYPCDMLRMGAGPDGRTCGRAGDWFEPREATS